jgi:transcriptional regulator with XRE-family HTH domain
MKDLPTFAARLRVLRDGAKMTQFELADRTGLNRQAIAKLETGRTHPTWDWDTVQRLARALGVDCRAFMVEEKAATPKTRKRKGS